MKNTGLMLYFIYIWGCAYIIQFMHVFIETKEITKQFKEISLNEVHVI